MIKASTLLETVFATAIITMVIVLGTMIYTNIAYSGLNYSFYELENHLKGISIQIENKEGFLEEDEFDFKDYKVLQTMEYFDNSEEVRFLKFQVINKGRIVKNYTYLLKQ
ncbi:hypothetical protein [Aureivirga marina]|uniref:hypothetical protein n=1 Tax=Aureivirga marina TaxID=1182451 RepID=UPI0018CA8030|nr:hypothetical protein [Aureivirga marina]